MNRIQHENLKLLHENQTENEVFIRLMKKLNVLIGMKHFMHMIMMANLDIHTIVAPLQTETAHLTEFLMKYHLVIEKRKNRKNSTKSKETKGKDKNTVIKE